VNVARSAEEAELQAQAGAALTAAQVAEAAAVGDEPEVGRFFEVEAREEAATEIASASAEDESESAEAANATPPAAEVDKEKV
ncbi:MAG: hypothetical protein V3T29_09745, partial [Alphaproteobacteria bacterium]